MRTKRLYLKGFSALKETTTYANAFSDIAEDTKKIVDSRSSVEDRVRAGISLASEFLSPVSVKDAKGIVQAVNNLTKREITNARRNAVRKAWKQEKNMVEKGDKGSRRWTKEQKAELSETGKVKGYEGHHINNVKDHPEMAGNSDNVIFVNREEHLQMHGGDFRNSTEGELIKREIKNE